MADEPLGIYLAGKISGSSWRDTIVDGLAEIQEHISYNYDNVTEIEWPRLSRAVLGRFDFTGPYYFAHCNHLHAASNPTGHGWNISREDIAMECCAAIARSDLVFAWIDQPNLYGTAVELGFARAMNKRIIVCQPDKHRAEGEDWFLTAVASNEQLDGYDLKRLFDISEPTALDYLRAELQVAGLMCESPIEIDFYNAWMRNGSCRIISQYRLGPYRLDFAIPQIRLAIELDGHDFHKTKEQRTHDASRDRWLAEAGWQTLRFTGSEIYKDADQCAIQALAIARQMPHQLNAEQLP